MKKHLVHRITESIAKLPFPILSHIPYRIITARGSGGKFRKKDPRDFKTDVLGWSFFGYEPKHLDKEIKTLSVKNQGSMNNCTWQAATVQKEVDEGVVLSARSLTAAGYKAGLISGNGFASLESPQKILKNVGILEASEIPEEVGWNSYINVDLERFKASFAKHKTQSYWSVTSKADLLKVLDEGKVVTTGIDWYTGFNQGGGFKSPWIITKAIGYKVGGHSIDIIGYKLKYNGSDVFICQNSYGNEWGDKGRFYISFDYILRNNYGFFVNLDIAVDTAAFLNKYDGKNVKGKGSTVWYIQKGKKKVYINWPTFLAFSVSVGKDIVQLTSDEEEILKKIPDGDAMDITKSVPWDYMKTIVNADDDDGALFHALLQAFNKLGIKL